jgi:hypothetical protein
MADELVESAIACIRLYAIRYELTAKELRALFSAGLCMAERECWLPRNIPVSDNIPGLPRFAGDDGEPINLMDDGTFMTSDGVRLRRPN